MYNVTSKIIDECIIYIGYEEDCVGYDLFIQNDKGIRVYGTVEGIDVEMRKRDAEHFSMLARLLRVGALDFDGVIVTILEGDF